MPTETQTIHALAILVPVLWQVVSLHLQHADGTPATRRKDMALLLLVIALALSLCAMGMSITLLVLALCLLVGSIVADQSTTLITASAVIAAIVIVMHVVYAPSHLMMPLGATATLTFWAWSLVVTYNPPARPQQDYSRRYQR